MEGVINDPPQRGDLVYPEGKQALVSFSQI